MTPLSSLFAAKIVHDGTNLTVRALKTIRAVPASPLVVFQSTPSDGGRKPSSYAQRHQFQSTPRAEDEQDTYSKGNMHASGAHQTDVACLKVHELGVPNTRLDNYSFRA